MSDAAALLRAILAHPDEDTPRLAYADWLDEHGDDAARTRAEFIRLQIEHARGVDARRQSFIEARCAELQSASMNDWLTPFRTASAVKALQPEFWRGFVSRVMDYLATDQSWFPHVSKVCPVQEITYGRLYGSDTTEFTALAECPALAKVRKLVCTALPEHHTAVLLGSPHLTGLKTLHLHRNCAGAVEALDRSAAARSLRELWTGQYGDTLVPGSGVGALLSAELPAFEVLHLHGAGGNEGANLLVAAFSVHGRKTLHIRDNDLSWPGAHRAIEAALTGPLDTLLLTTAGSRRADGDPIPVGRTLRVEQFAEQGDRIAAWLASVLPPGRFDWLSVVGCHISRTGARALANWEGAADLTGLDLSHNWIGDIGATHLAESPYLANVKQLFVAHNDITRKGKDALKKRFGRRVRVA